MSRSADRCSTLERGSPKTEPRSCGTQPAHESLFNRRLRVLSPAVRTNNLLIRCRGRIITPDPLKANMRQLSPSVAAGLVHFVIAVPVELDGVVVAAASEGTGHTAEGELAAGRLEQD